MNERKVREKKVSKLNWTKLKWNGTKRSFRSKCQKNAWINKTNGAYFVQFYCCILLINKWIRAIVSMRERNVVSLQLSNAQFNGIRHIFFRFSFFFFHFVFASLYSPFSFALCWISSFFLFSCCFGFGFFV